jgi:hypothetical protein
MVDAEFLLQQAVLRFHHVADRILREAHARLHFRIARRARKAVADRIRADDEVFVGIERLAGADHEVDAVVIAAERRHHQDGVGFLFIQRAVRHVGDRKVCDCLTAFELEVTFVVKLVWRLLWRMRRGRNRQQQAKPSHLDDAFHACSPYRLTFRSVARDDTARQLACEAFCA